jgi:hypothetical protein
MEIKIIKKWASRAFRQAQCKTSATIFFVPDNIFLCKFYNVAFENLRQHENLRQQKEKNGTSRASVTIFEALSQQDNSTVD